MKLTYCACLYYLDALRLLALEWTSIHQVAHPFHPLLEALDAIVTVADLHAVASAPCK